MLYAALALWVILYQLYLVQKAPAGAYTVLAYMHLHAARASVNSNPQLQRRIDGLDRAIGSLRAAIAHETNNPIAAITRVAQRMKRCKGGLSV